MGPQGRQRGEWKVENGYMETVPKTGYLYTRDAFGDCQLHVEFDEPIPPKGEGQGRGNSGIFLHGLYEIKCSIPTKIKRTRMARPQRSTVNIRRSSTLRARPASGRRTTSFSTVHV